MAIQLILIGDSLLFVSLRDDTLLLAANNAPIFLSLVCPYSPFGSAASAVGYEK